MRVSSHTSPIPARSRAGRTASGSLEREGTSRSRTALVALLLAIPLLVPTTAAAQTDPDVSTDELQRQLDEAESEAGSLGSQLGDQRARVGDAEEQLAHIGSRLEDARGRLRAAEGQLALAEAALGEAEVERADAVEAADAADAELARTEAELAAEEGALADQAVAAFKFGSVGSRAGSAAFDMVRQASDPNDLAIGMHQIGQVIDDQGETVDRVAELRDANTVASAEATHARSVAAQAAADAAAQVRFTDGLRAEAEALTAQVAEEEAAQEALTVELRAVADETGASLARVAARQEALTAELSARRAAEEARRREAAERAAAEAAAEAAAAVQASPEPTPRGASGGGGGPSVDGVCPVVGAVAGRDFSNDWGYPRSGGRTHQGNDVFADRGTPVVAISDAVVVRVNATESGLGGLTVTYRTGDGSEWYNAHLESVAPGIAPGVSVARGEQVGSVGDTGNARGTPPHNHIGRRHGGGWVNPWPTIGPLCR